MEWAQEDSATPTQIGRLDEDGHFMPFHAISQDMMIDFPSFQIPESESFVPFPLLGYQLAYFWRDQVGDSEMTTPSSEETQACQSLGWWQLQLFRYLLQGLG